MGFFAEFDTWLNALLATYIGDNTARLAAALAPLIVALAVIYVLVWGYLMFMGQIKTPLTEGVKRLVTVAIILGVSLNLWLYNEVIVDTVFTAPSQLAAVIAGAYDSVEVVDAIIFAGADTGNLLMQKAGVFDGNFSFYFAAFAVYIVVGLTAIYTIFLLSLSRIALSVLLALGPLFIGLLFFETTKRFFGSWLAQLSNYAFITILTVLCAALMLHVIRTAAEQAVAAGGGIEIAHAVRVCMAAGLTFLVMRQVMPMAAGLASGSALVSFGVVSAAIGWAIGSAAVGGRRFIAVPLRREPRGGSIQSQSGVRYARP